MKTSNKDSFPASGFDTWAESYDTSVRVDEFPFMGYEQVLKKIFSLAKAQRGSSILDVGTGTGNLAMLFAQAGCIPWCTDFAPAMLAEAKRKLPGAHFLQHDIRQPLPAPFKKRYDLVVSAYVFHHFNLADKVRLSSMLIKHLSPHGKLVVADIAFPDYASQEKVQQLVGADWEEEFYWLADETLVAYHNAGLQAYFEPVSLCAGVFVIT